MLDLNRSIVVYSGGIDSRTVLARAIELHGKNNVIALTFDYSQRHSVEIDYAKRVCSAEGVEHIILPIPFMREIFKTSSLTSSVAVPEGHYESETMKNTVVPNRNMIFLSIAIGLAIERKADIVYCGVHAGDHAIYADCRPEFIASLDAISRELSEEPIRVSAPFLHASKKDIIAAGIALQVDYSTAWTCYNGGSVPCGKCGACTERQEAFSQLGLEDPLLHRDNSCR